MVAEQNFHNLARRQFDNVVDYCERHAIGFIPFYPLQTGVLAETAPLITLAGREGTKPTIIPIPGTSSIDHLEEHLSATRITLPHEDMATLKAL